MTLRERAIAEYDENLTKHNAAMAKREEQDRLSRLNRFRELLREIVGVDESPSESELIYEDLLFRLEPDTWALQVLIPCPKAASGDDDHCAYHRLENHEDFISVMAGNSWAWSCEQCDANRLEERRMTYISRPEQTDAEKLGDLIIQIARSGGCSCGAEL